MPRVRRPLALLRPLAIAATLALATPGLAAGDDRAALRHPGDKVLLTLNGRGAQVYACRADAAGAAPAWAFQRPEADLFDGDTRVGQHGAGPFWQLRDGSRITAKPVAKADGAGPDDVAWLRLAVDSHAGAGLLTPVTTVLRTDTRGGALAGPCDTIGATRAVPYAATYLFVAHP